MKSTKIAAIALLASLSLPAFAQFSSTERIDQRQANQERRIEEGVRSGQINRREESRLRAELRDIRRMERRAAADGRVSRSERAEIEAAQDRLSQRINRERHDYQARRS